MPLIDIFGRLSSGEIAFWQAFELAQTGGVLAEAKPDPARAKRRVMMAGLREHMRTLGERGERGNSRKSSR